MIRRRLRVGGPVVLTGTTFVSDTAPPSPPSNLAATAAGSSQINLAVGGHRDQ